MQESALLIKNNTLYRCVQKRAQLRDAQTRLQYQKKLHIVHDDGGTPPKYCEVNG
jgi:hypothetical protein